MNVKEKIRSSLENTHDNHFLVANDLLAFFTILSVIGIVLETVPDLRPWKFVFNFIEYATVIVFTVEYIARVYAARKKTKYVFSFFGIIDILSILPTYFGLANLTFLKTARIVRILRFLRMVRLAKVSRSSSLRDPEDSSSLYKLNIGIYFLTLVGIVLFLGSLIYIVEEGNQAFSSIPMGMVWASKVVLGGLGGVTSIQIPVTAMGEALTLLARFCGLLLFGLLINVVGNVTRTFLLGNSSGERIQ